MILDAATPARTMIAVAAALLLIGNTGWAIGTSDYVIEDAQYEIDNGNFEEAVNVLEQVIEAETLERAFESNDETAVDSIFGEDLISEKTLDEVILSYLAEDMQRG